MFLRRDNGGRTAWSLEDAESTECRAEHRSSPRHRRFVRPPRALPPSEFVTSSSARPRIFVGGSGRALSLESVSRAHDGCLNILKINEREKNCAPGRRRARRGRVTLGASCSAGTRRKARPRCRRRRWVTASHASRTSSRTHWRAQPAPAREREREREREIRRRRDDDDAQVGGGLVAADGRVQGQVHVRDARVAASATLVWREGAFVCVGRLLTSTGRETRCRIIRWAEYVAETRAIAKAFIARVRPRPPRASSSSTTRLVPLLLLLLLLRERERETSAPVECRFLSQARAQAAAVRLHSRLQLQRVARRRPRHDNRATGVSDFVL